MSKKEIEMPQRLEIYMSKIKENNLKKVDMGKFMKWLGSNLDRFKEENRIYYYDKLTNEQSENFTKFLENI